MNCQSQTVVWLVASPVAFQHHWLAPMTKFELLKVSASYEIPRIWMPHTNAKHWFLPLSNAFVVSIPSDSSSSWPPGPLERKKYHLVWRISSDGC